MPNLCDTCYKVRSTKENIDKLWSVLESLDVNHKYILLCDLADALKIEYEGRGYSYRGHVYWAERDSDDLLSFDTETAWSACSIFFEHLNKDAFNNELSISYMEMEPGCQVYYIHDEEDFFPYRYVVQAELWREGYVYETYNETFISADEVINEWCKAMGVERDKSLSDEEYISYIDDYEYADDSYFSVSQFEVI